MAIGTCGLLLGDKVLILLNFCMVVWVEDDGDGLFDRGRTHLPGEWTCSAVSSNVYALG